MEITRRKRRKNKKKERRGEEDEGTRSKGDGIIGEERNREIESSYLYFQRWPKSRSDHRPTPLSLPYNVSPYRFPKPTSTARRSPPSIEISTSMVCKLPSPSPQSSLHQGRNRPCCRPCTGKASSMAAHKNSQPP